MYVMLSTPQNGHIFTTATFLCPKGAIVVRCDCSLDGTLQDYYHTVHVPLSDSSTAVTDALYQVSSWVNLAQQKSPTTGADIKPPL